MTHELATEHPQVAPVSIDRPCTQPVQVQFNQEVLEDLDEFTPDCNIRFLDLP